jgi:DNA polymerase-3 subunit delta
MKAADFLQQLERGEIQRAYLFIGDAHGVMEQAWLRLRDVLAEGAGQRFHGETLAARDVSAAEVMARLSTRAMFSKRRLIRVQGIEAWGKDHQQDLGAYLGKPGPGTCLVLTCAQRKPVAALATVMEGVGSVVDFAPPSPGELPGWVHAQARAAGHEMTAEAAALLVERAGPQPHALEGELAKLCLYVGQRERIEAADVEHVVSPRRQHSVFELLRHVGKGEGLRAVAVLRRLLLSGEPPLVILHLLARQIRLTWQIKDGLERSVGNAELRQRLKLPEFALREYQRSAALFSEEALRRAHELITAGDLALKSSAAAPENLMEALILSLALPPRRSTTARKRESRPDAP